MTLKVSDLPLPGPDQDVERPYLDPDQIDSSFPMEQYREGQREAIEFAVKAFNDGKRMVILECPTGSGKSAIAMTLAEMVKRSYYLTITKILQDQLTRDFQRSIVVLKGRNAYPCTFYKREGAKMVDRQIWTQEQLEQEAAIHTDCGVGFCRSRWNSTGNNFYCGSCFPKHNPSVSGRTGTLESLPLGMTYSACPYYEQVYAALNSRKVAMNFSSFLYQTMMTKRFNSPRDLMIVDECHNVEPQLLSFVSFSITDSHLQRKGIFIPELETPYDYYNWFLEADVLGSIRDAIKEANQRDDARTVDELARLASKYDLFVKHVQEDKSGVEWVSEYDEKQNRYGGATHRRVTIKPVFVHSFANKLLFNYAKCILLMSATVLDVDVICRSLGLHRSQVAAKRVRNRFPKANRPIYVKPVAKMTGGKKAMSRWAPPLMRGVDDIADRHSGEKGIIHTHNFAIMEYILEHCSSGLKSRLLNQRDFHDKFEMLREHSRSKDTVLIAPAMHEGIDLAGPLCYDCQTEVLTVDGWRGLPYVSEDDEVAVFDASDYSIRFEEPIQVIDSTADDWVEIGNATNDLLVTASHRMLWFDTITGRLQENTADQRPPDGAYQFVSGGLHHGGGLELLDDEIRLIAALQSEGFRLSSGDHYLLFVPGDPAKVVFIGDVLQRLGIQYTTQVQDSGLVFTLPWYRVQRLAGLTQVNNNAVWDMNNLLKLSLYQRQLLIRQLSFWNGSAQSPPNQLGPIVYDPRRPEDLDTIQAVAVLSGFNTVRDDHRLICRLGTLHGPGSPGGDLEHQRHKFPRRCYCLQVSTGWLVVRRRGKVSISGNSRFQVICKIPFANCFDDKQLARRVQLDRRYYVWLTALKLVQSYGRSVRSDTDYASTYILDESIYKFLIDAKKMLPQWFQEAIIHTDNDSRTR